MKSTTILPLLGHSTYLSAAGWSFRYLYFRIPVEDATAGLDLTLESVYTFILLRTMPPEPPRRILVSAAKGV